MEREGHGNRRKGKERNRHGKRNRGKGKERDIERGENGKRGTLGLETGKQKLRKS